MSIIQKKRKSIIYNTQRNVIFNECSIMNIYVLRSENQKNTVRSEKKITLAILITLFAQIKFLTHANVESSLKVFKTSC